MDQLIVRGPEHVVSLAGEFALDDEPALERLASLRLPGAGECAVPPGIARVKEGLNRLSKDFPRDGEAQLLEAIPAETVKVVYSLPMLESGGLCSETPSV
jgi:hypothetical protein